MTCDEVLFELDGGEPSAEVRAHLAGCRDCREAARVVGWAALPPLSEAERATLGDLPRRVLAQAARALPRSASPWRQVAQLAVAAGLGALVASTAVLRLRPATLAEPRVVEVAVEVPSLPEPDEQPNLSDDEVFFEVSWPDENET